MNHPTNQSRTGDAAAAFFRGIAEHGTQGRPRREALSRGVTGNPFAERPSRDVTQPGERRGADKTHMHPGLQGGPHVAPPAGFDELEAWFVARHQAEATGGTDD